MLLPPPPDSSENFLRDKNIQLEKDVTDLTKKYDAVVHDCENAKKVIESLEKKNLEADLKADLKAEEAKIEKEKRFSKEIENLNCSIADRDQEILALQLAIKAEHKSTHENR